MTDMVLCCGSALRAQALYREKGPRAGATGTGVRPRTPNSRDCGRTPVNKYSAVSSSSKGCNQTFSFAGKGFCQWTIQKCVDQPDFLRIVLLTEFLTPIFSSTNPGRCNKFCKGSGSG
ncbi:hypothetical protein MTP99_000737 [Tenebrio molitor]|nr:hypothetical protein MTP99_000737 [Tenebrio molitor]